MLDCLFAEFLCLGLFLTFKAQCLRQIEKDLCLAGCHVVAKREGYHLVCIWGRQEGSNRAGLLFYRACSVLDCLFAEFLCLGLFLTFKAKCFRQVEEGFCLAGSHVVAQRHGYHLVYIWGSLGKFQGVGLF